MMRIGSRVRQPGRSGVVIEVVKGAAQDAVLVEWDESQMDSSWNRYRRSWEPAATLQADK